MISKFTLATLCLLICAMSFARPMTSQEQSLYQDILDTQIQNHIYPSYVGSWPTKSRVASLINFETTSSFEIVQILLALKSVTSYVSIPDPHTLNDVFELGYRQLDGYLAESATTKEPLGTVNFYPIRDHQRNLRGFPSLTRDIAFQVLGYSIEDANLPNDMDCSARTYTLLQDRPKNATWAEGFAQTAGYWVDRNRTEIHPSENWKPKNSGAFLTWAEPDGSANQKSRILGGRNDVDCVVNLNVLEALGVNEKKAELPAATLKAKHNSCNLINQVMAEGQQGSINRCSVYYKRPSQVLLSYVRALSSMGANDNCLQPSYQQAYEIAYQLAWRSAHRSSLFSPVLEKAELVIVLKSLIPPERRPPEVAELIKTLSGQLRTFYAGSSESMYEYAYKGWQLEFWSPAFSKAFILLSMVMP